MTGFGPAGSGANFSLAVAGLTVYGSPHLSDYCYGSNRTNYSAAVHVVVPNLDVHVAPADVHVSIIFDNNDRNLQLLLPLRVVLTCTNGPCVAYPLLPTFIASNMVLQRSPALANVWGQNAKPGMFFL